MDCMATVLVFLRDHYNLPIAHQPLLLERRLSPEGQDKKAYRICCFFQGLVDLSAIQCVPVLLAAGGVEARELSLRSVWTMERSCI